nr:hypothetical protein [Tanacetum cinerariifolium]
MDSTIRLRRENIARLEFCYLSVFPSSSVVTYASATFPCIVLIIDSEVIATWKHLDKPCIYYTELSVIGAAKMAHFEILCRVYGFEPTVGLFRCFILAERLDRPFFWIDAFAYPTLFSWHTGKSVSRDVIPKSSEFSSEHYATLVAYPTLFHKYPKPFICLVGMSQIDLLSVIRTVDPMKVRIGERHRDEDEPKLLETTIGRVVSLLPFVPDHSSGELEASRLLAEAVQNTEVRGGVIPTLPFVSSSVSTIPEREGRDHIELLARVNLCAIGAPQRFVISSDSSNHSGVNIVEAEVDSVVKTSVPIITIATTTTPTADPAAIAKEKLVGSSVFGADSPSAGESHPIPGGFSDCTGSDFLIGGIQIVIDPDSNIQKFYVPQWNVTNGFCLDDSGVCREMVEEFDPPKFFASVREMDHDQLFTEFNIGAACQISLSTKVRMRVEYNVKERRMLNSVVEEKDLLLKSRCEETKSLKAQLLVKETEAVKAIHLLNVREQEVADLDDVVTSVKLQNDSLADQVHKLEASSAGLHEKVTVYENSAIGKAIEKGMQEGLSASITYGTKGRKLIDVAAYNPYVEPHVDQLMVPVHHSPDQCVIGASALSLSLDVSSSRVRKIKENIANHVSALCGVFVPLSEPLSAMVLEGTKGTSGAAPDTTTALSGAGVGGETVANESVVPFPNVSDAELDVPK